ncbi:MAG: hypothetical protein IJB38_04055 [Bacteroidales bacterium]|nr:hypothetical protein [Bacteroidales bacterium]
MKKFLIFIALAVMPLTVLAQAQIDTKKVKIGDFTQKITKVVLTGGAMFDGVLQEEIAARWRVSPYEFCTLEEFNSLKDNDNYYFLLTTKGQFKRETEPSLQFLTLIKGGKNASKGIDEMLEIVSLPICAADDPSGRELIFLPVFLTIIQEYALDSMDKDYNAYGGLGNYTSNITKSSDMKIVFSEDDINSSVPESEYADFCITDEDTADLYITNNTPGFLVSYVVAPAEPVNGSFCYKMLIDAQTYKLYYFRKHRITPKAGAGFMSFDLRSINSARVNHR